MTISAVDTMLDQLFHGLEERNLTDIVNVIIVSDHGMATTDINRMIQIEDLVDMDKVEHLDGWPLVGIRPKNPEDLQVLYDQAAEKGKSNPNFDVYLRDENMPERYHFSNNKRIAPLWIVPKTGWAIVDRKEFNIEEAKAKNLVFHPRGLHGYDHEHPLMRAIFVARGPAFPHQPHSKVEVFRMYPHRPLLMVSVDIDCKPIENINVYNILCDSVSMKAMPNNGTLRLPLEVMGLHDPETVFEEPADPVSAAEGVSAVEDVSTGATSTLPVATGAESTEPSSTVSVEPTAKDKPVVETPEGAKDEDKPESPDSPWWENAYDWVKDKFDGLADKISGAFNDSS